MRHEIKKISRMADELATFFLEQHAQDISIQIKNTQNQAIIYVKAKPIEDMHAMIELLNDSLSTPRQSEMEEYYWELAGDSDYSNELCIVGSMTDIAKIDFDEHEIRLEIIRNKHA